MTDPDHDELFGAAKAKLIKAFPKLPLAQQEPDAATIAFATLVLYMEELRRCLDKAFEEKSGAEVTLQLEQRQYAEALAAFGRFLKKTYPEHADRFFILHDAFIDALEGAHPRLLKFRGPGSGHPRKPADIEEARACVAFAVDALTMLGVPAEDAAKQLRKKFPGLENLVNATPHRMRPDWHAPFLEWRNSLSARSRKKNEVARKIFEAGRALALSFVTHGRSDELRAQVFKRAAHAERIANAYARERQSK